MTGCESTRPVCGIDFFVLRARAAMEKEVTARAAMGSTLNCRCRSEQLFSMPRRRAAFRLHHSRTALHGSARRTGECAFCYLYTPSAYRARRRQTGRVLQAAAGIETIGRCRLGRLSKCREIHSFRVSLPQSPKSRITCCCKTHKSPSTFHCEHQGQEQR